MRGDANDATEIEVGFALNMQLYGAVASLLVMEGWWSKIAY